MKFGKAAAKVTDDLVALVRRAGARFEGGKLVERPDDPPAAQAA